MFCFFLRWEEAQKGEEKEKRPGPYLCCGSIALEDYASYTTGKKEKKKKDKKDKKKKKKEKKWLVGSGLGIIFRI